MSPNRRNLLVGITVMVGLVGLATMLIKFGGTTVEFIHGGEQVKVQLISDRADGLTEGAQVLYRGVSVGRVTSVRRDNNNLDVIIDTLIASNLPGNVTGRIRTLSLVSGISAIELELTGGIDAKPEGTLPDGGKLPAKFVGVDLIPPEITAELSSAGDLIKGLNSYVNDPTIHQNLQASIESIHDITEKVRHFSDRLDKISDEANSTLTDTHAAVRATQADVDKLSRQIDDRMLQISKSLDTFESITNKINKGQGTAGLLLNDPKLYDSLVENSRQLNLTIADLKRLIEQWEQEGVSFKLK